MNLFTRLIVHCCLIATILPLMAAAMAEDRPSQTPGDAEALSVSFVDGEYSLSLADGVSFHTTPNEVLDARVIDAPDSTTRLALWREAAPGGGETEFYAISLDGDTVDCVREADYRIKLRDARFDPLAGAAPIDPVFSASSDGAVYIVQFVTQPLAEFRAQIGRLGGQVRKFLANYAYIVEMQPATRAAVEALPYVRWVGPYHPAYRLEAFLRDNMVDADDLFPMQRYNIQVFERGLKQKHAVADGVRALGGKINSSDAGKFLIEATLTPDQLYEVARWDEVAFIDRWSPFEKDMNNARELGGANHIETVAGFTGAGVRGEVFDAGFNLSHVDFASRPLIIHGSAGSDSHGSSTSGIVFGDGTGNPNARGMLPDGQGIVANYSGIMEGPGNPTPRYIHTGELVQDPYYAVFQTSSVGSDRTTQYTTISADSDAALFDFDIVHCQSQSNAGDQMSRPQAWAKNIISGGGAYHYDTLDTSDDCWCGGGSTGPATDGRIKPDLCGFYDDILTTTAGGSTAYTTDFGGTSGATPIIAGHVGLFFQMWSEGVFGNEVTPGATVFENRSHMTTAKAMMINTASPYPFTGTASDMTRVHQGWGWPDLQYMYDTRERMFIINEDRVLGNLETAVYPLAVLAGEASFRATLVFADPPGLPGAAEARINDLTLKVTSPAGTEYWGNHGLLEGVWSTPGGAANTVDTVENVFVENPESGVWIVEVIASEVNEDGHVETPELDADFALVVSGVTPCSSAGAVSLNRSAYMCDDIAEVRVVDCDLNTDDNVAETVDVTVDSDSEPLGEIVTLTESGPATAVFVGQVTLSDSNGGALLVAHGDTVTATYIDADDGMGGTNITLTDTAIVDCVSPMLSNVQTSDIGPRSANVSFDSDEPARGTVYYGTDCGSLTETASSGTYETAPVITLTGLTENTTYYYAVEGRDLAGNSAYDDNGGACYSFTTPDIPDFFTEEFTGDNDLDNKSLLFSPNGSVDYYTGCVTDIASLPTDPAGGAPIVLSDDDSKLVSLTGGAQVLLYGHAYSSFYVGSNGYITFGSSDTDYSETIADHFSLARVAALFDDLNPSDAGTVSWKQLADRAVVTYENVTEYGAGNSNTFQIELFFSGDITISYLQVDVTDGIAGLSEGVGEDPDFYETDLSAMGSCGPRPPTASGGAVSTPVNQAAVFTLLASDDGLPDPPAALTYTVTALPANGVLSDPGAGVIDSVPYVLVGGGNQVEYQPDLWYVGPDSLSFYADDGGVPPDGGQSNEAVVSIDVTPPAPIVYYDFTLDSDPGWTTEGQWAFGQPTGGGSQGGDPTSGHTGSNVYGYNLAGDYTDNMPAYRLTTTPIDCSELANVELSFWRWLGVESASFDHARVEVSNNGTAWTELYANPSSSFSDTAWTQMSFDISSIADGQATVYVRWTMGTTDGSVTYPGWNVDDVQILAPAPYPEIPGDLDLDCDVDLTDLGILLDNYGATGGVGYEDGDIDLDGDVDLTDLGYLLAYYGEVCP